MVDAAWLLAQRFWIGAASAPSVGGRFHGSLPAPDFQPMSYQGLGTVSKEALDVRLIKNCIFAAPQDSVPQMGRG